MMGRQANHGKTLKNAFSTLQQVSRMTGDGLWQIASMKKMKARLAVHPCRVVQQISEMLKPSKGNASNNHMRLSLRMCLILTIGLT